MVVPVGIQQLRSITLYSKKQHNAHQMTAYIPNYDVSAQFFRLCSVLIESPNPQIVLYYLYIPDVLFYQRTHFMEAGMYEKMSS